jgi:cystathionine beta-lyase
MNTLGIVANQAAYAGGEEWLRQCVNYIDGNHDFAVDYIKKNLPLVKAYKAEGTYLMWLDLTGLAEKIDAKGRADKFNREKAANAAAKKPEQMIEEWLVRNAKVHLNAGNSYGKGSDNHMRMNIATSRKTLEKALSNMAGAMRAGTTSMAQG